MCLSSNRNTPLDFHRWVRFYDSVPRQKVVRARVVGLEHKKFCDKLQLRRSGYTISNALIWSETNGGRRGGCISMRVWFQFPSDAERPPPLLFHKTPGKDNRYTQGCREVLGRVPEMRMPETSEGPDEENGSECEHPVLFPDPNGENEVSSS